MKSRFFNTEGPTVSSEHYALKQRLDESELEDLIARSRYFVLHAPRQTGKTTAIREYVEKLNREAEVYALYVNFEPAQAARNNVVRGILTILDQIKLSIERDFPTATEALSFFERRLNPNTASGNEFSSFLQHWSMRTDKPIVLFIDEIDSLVGDTLISVLRQLRSGYTNRPKAFPKSVCLIGVRDVRDFRIWYDEKNAVVLGGSAFNIKAQSIRLSDFSKKEVKDLYGQHTKETGQKFTTEALNYAFDQTQGQPWLVNALAYQACFRDVKDAVRP